MNTSELRSHVLLNQYAPMQNLELLENPSQSFFTDIQTRKQAKTARDSWKKQNKKNAKWHSSALVACEPVASLQQKRQG